MKGNSVENLDHELIAYDNIFKQMEANKILVITTGGTIDKTYNERKGRLENIDRNIENNLKKLLRLPGTQIEFVSLMQKDSLHMTCADWEVICSTIEEYQYFANPIVVLHGTDTLEYTVQYCSQKIPRPKVPIVFTGAMKPFGFVDSDAIQNVCEAFLVAKLLKPNFYVSFHNRVFLGNNVQKNKDTLTFETKEPATVPC